MHQIRTFLFFSFENYELDVKIYPVVITYPPSGTISMISRLVVQNFGLIDKLAIEFGSELNIFTGETGAGKSILIDALYYGLGGKLKAQQLRDADKPCIVEIVFELSDNLLKTYPHFSEYAIDEPLLIIKRTYLPTGRSKSSINGFSVTTSQLAEIGNHLVDFHGPHDHQLLFSEESHIHILDRLSDMNIEKDEYAKRYTTYELLQKELNKLALLSQERERQLDILSSQVKELEQVPLDSGKYEELLKERTRINNSEKLYECVANLINILENEETGVNSAVSRAFGSMKSLNDIDESTVSLSETLSRIQEDSAELVNTLTSYMEGLSFEADEAGRINSLYDIYYEIQRKYGPTLEDANAFYEKAKEKHDLLINLEHNSSELKEKMEAARKDLIQSAKKITAKRKKTAKALEETIKQELKDLGIKHVQFECRIEKEELSSTGQDKVVFFISPNVGEALKPLAEIVSSGEAARVMLALKKALTKVDPIPVLIFDEIDAQIGGRLGSITGKKLKELAQNRQVILITHLPQIASFGDHHFKVLKEVVDTRTVTKVEFLDKDSRIKELAKMMSGEKESQIAVKHAHDMLTRAKTAA